MRTIAIIASAGLLAAAEQPKPKPELSRTARIALKFISSESKRLSEQKAALSKQLETTSNQLEDIPGAFEAIKTEECQRIHGLDKCEITDAGLVIPAPAKKEAKK